MMLKLDNEVTLDTIQNKYEVTQYCEYEVVEPKNLHEISGILDFSI